MLTKAEKQRFIDALLSGEYTQGPAYLNGPEGFCCLGVATEVFKDEIPDIETVDRGPEFPKRYVTPLVPSGVDASLLDELVRKLGLSALGNIDSSPCLKGAPTIHYDGAVYCSLSSANDNEVPFEFIAKYLQEHMLTSD